MTIDRLESKGLESKGLEENAFGAYLKECRARLDPAAFGFPATSSRRTPGLRREEVAARADVSATWYTWLEQGRGGVPSADALDRIAHALTLTPVEREHLFLLAQNRPPELRAGTVGSVTPRLQHVLDALESCPALVKTATWDVVAWNRAAASVLTDYGALAPRDRNILRLLFGHSRIRACVEDWEGDARFAVAVFRTEITRTGAHARAEELIADLSQRSPEFRAMWADHDVRMYGEGTKRMDHPVVGPFTMGYSTFAVGGEPDLGMLVYTPVTPADADRIRSLVGSGPGSSARI